METYRKSSHTVYDLKYHLVWVTQYRKPVFRGEIAERMRDLIREICKVNDVEILKGHISKGHVHVFVSVPPHISVSELMQSVKGETSRKMLMEYKSLSRAFWGAAYVGSGLFCGQLRQWDRRSDHEVHRTTRVRATRQGLQD